MVVDTVKLPDNLTALLRQDSYSSEFRHQARSYLHRAILGDFESGPGKELTKLLQLRKWDIEQLVDRADELAGRLTAAPSRSLVITHGDLHKWNIQVRADGDLLIVDWDDVKLAPKERDLMFIGGNIGGDTGDEFEEQGFYHGYGEVHIDPVALAYYRYERIVVDLVEYCQELWEGTGVDDETCQEIVKIMASQFEPGNVLEAAHLTYRAIA